MTQLICLQQALTIKLNSGIIKLKLVSGIQREFHQQGKSDLISIKEVKRY